MPIITISRGSYSRGKEIAEKVAAKLGYECIARDVLLETSEHFNVPEIKLVRAIHDAPGILDRFGHKKGKYVAFIETELLKRVKNDNTVYHGLAGHFFLTGISHVLKVRILADMEERVKLEMEREKISKEKAYDILKKDDEERRKWSMNLYGIDTNNPQLYDLIVHIGQITAEVATDTICDIARKKEFQATDESRKALEDRLLAAEVKAVLVHKIPDIQASADNGVVTVTGSGPTSRESTMTREIQRIAKTVDGVKEVKVDFSRETIYE